MTNRFLLYIIVLVLSFLCVVLFEYNILDGWMDLFNIKCKNIVQIYLRYKYKVY